MIRRVVPGHRARAVLLLVLLGALGAGIRWVADLRPRLSDLQARSEALRAERGRLAETRAQLLRFGAEGIATRNQFLRAEVERREALAPVGSADAAALAVRERFGVLAARYGVHAPTFEQMPVSSQGDLRIGSMRVRAAGGYHALGTWITEALSDERLLDVREARLEAVPDSLMLAVRASAGTPAAPSAAPGQGGEPGASNPLNVVGAAPLDAVVEFVVHWYSLETSAVQTGGVE
jgi:hypothetical protein